MGKWVNRKHTPSGGDGFKGFGGSHAVETTVVVVRVAWSRLPSGCDAVLLLGWFIGLGGGIVSCFHQFLRAFIGVMTHNSTLIAGHSGLVSWSNRCGVASSPWGIVVEVVVVAMVVVVVVVVVASGLRVSSIMVGVVRTRCRNRWPAGSWCISST